MLSTGSQQEKVEETLDFCEMHRMVTEVPIEKVEEMRDELRQHPDEATLDGKPVETVVGNDAIAFAEEWAAQNRPPKPLLWKVSAWTGMQAAYAAFILMAAHLLYWSLDLPLAPSAYLLGFALFLLNAWTATRMRLTPSFKLDGPPLLQAAVLCGISALTLATLAGIDLTVNAGEALPLSHRAWQATLMVLALAFLPSGSKQDWGRLPPRPDQRTYGD